MAPIRQASSNRWVCSFLVFAWLGASAATVRAQESPFSIRAGLLSALVVRGLQFSDASSPVVLAGVDLYDPAGWSVGAAGMVLRSAAGNEAGGWVLHASHDWSLDEKWTLAIGARHDGYVGDRFLRSWCYNEMDATATYGDWLNASVGWRPNGGPGCPATPTTGTKPDLAFDLNAQWPFAAGFGANAGIGRLFDGGAGSYDYGQGGIFAGGKSWAVHVGRTFTHGASSYGDAARGHWLASAIWRF